MLNELTEWMNSKGFHTLTQFKAKMNAKAAGEINPFERTQFMKYYSNYNDLFSCIFKENDKKPKQDKEFDHFRCIGKNKKIYLHIIARFVH